MRLKITKCGTEYDCKNPQNENGKYYLWRDRGSHFTPNLTCTKCLSSIEFYIQPDFCCPVDWAPYNPEGDYKEIYLFKYEKPHPRNEIILELINIMKETNTKIKVMTIDFETTEYSLEQLTQMLEIAN